MNFKVGDKVVVIAGKSKGVEGKIIKTLKKENSWALGNSASSKLYLYSNHYY